MEALSKEELYAKYNIYESKGKRYYEENLSSRDFSLECVTPFSFTYKGIVIEEGSWINLLPKIADLFFCLNNKSKADALGLNVSWTRQTIFSEAQKTNYKKLAGGIFLNCNMTALHSVWLIQDLLTFFDANYVDAKLIIHRPSFSEPEEVKQNLSIINKDLFGKYLNKISNFFQSDIQIITKNIDILSEKCLPLIGKSYDNFFLFDDAVILKTYCAKSLHYLTTNNIYSYNVIKRIEVYFNYLVSFFQILLTIS